MKASFMLTTQRQNCNLRNGRVLGLQDPKKDVCKKANWRRCSLVALNKRGSYTGRYEPPGMTVNAGFYCDVLRSLLENVAAQEAIEMAKPEPLYASRECPGSQVLQIFAVFGQEQHDSDPPSPILTRSGPLVTFSSSPSWSFGWRVEDSTPLNRFKRNRSGYLTQFEKRTSRDASKHGRNAGTAVFVQKGSTLKVMEEFNIQGKKISFYQYCTGTFGYILVLRLL